MRSPLIRNTALFVVIAVPVVLGLAAPASAATVTVTTWSTLQSAFLVDGDIVLLGADITAPDDQNLAVDAGETITLNLNGYALTITNPGESNAAVSVPATSSLTINDTSGGTLTATGGGSGSGIGGGDSGNGGTLTIDGGTVTATGGYPAAGIGGGYLGLGGTTTINGGTVTATGGLGAAGIGGGWQGTGGTTTLNGGTTTATGGFSGAGIGGGNFADGGITTINGGTTTATGGHGAAGIGGGARHPDLGGGGGGTTILNGGTVTATGGASLPDGDGAAGIGGGNAGSAGVFQVNGTPDIGAATDGGNPVASPITNPTTPAGIGYFATTSAVGDGGKIELRFNYLVTFTENGGNGTASLTIDDGDTLTEPAAPTREGFTFAGWTSDGSAYDFSTPVTAPLELTATWTAVLAATGADVTTPLGIATLLLAGGVTLLALRRRAAPHTT